MPSAFVALTTALASSAPPRSGSPQDDRPLDVLGFLRHIADILLADEVKSPGKIRLALGAQYRQIDFLRTYTLEAVRARHPGLFYEAVHHALLTEHPLDLDRNLQEMITSTMLARPRPGPDA